MTTKFNEAQIDTLLRPLNSSRVAKRNVAGSAMSYLEAWDVRAHLIRVFGFGGFDVITEECDLVYEAERATGNGYEVAYKARVTLRVRGEREGGDRFIDDVEYTEVAVGSAIGPNRADLHDNAAKSAVSDAMKRCAINLGTQFGLSLYDNGTTADVVKGVVGRDKPKAPIDPEKEQMLATSLGATPLDEGSGVSEGDANGIAP